MKIKILIIAVLIFGLFHNVNALSEEIIVAYENREQPPYYLGYTTKIPSMPGIAVEMVMRLEKRIANLTHF